MKVYQSDLFAIEYREKDRLMLPYWTGVEMSSEDFQNEMKVFMSLLKKTGAKKAVWDHTNFRFQIPEALYSWIETNVNLPAKDLGCHKLAFILGEEVRAQFSTIDCFEVTHSVYTPTYFSNHENAIRWANKRVPVLVNPFEKEISMTLQKVEERGSAIIRIEVSLEQLPYFMKELKTLFNQQAYVHKNYQKFMLLTAREKEVLGLLLQGNNNKTVADRLFTSVHTVTTHRKNILRKLECKSFSDLLKFKLFI